MPDDAAEGAAAREVGTRLREARLGLGRELGDLARDLRIRETWLFAIEEGRLDDLPGAPFRTGFVRSYANRLGLDGAALAAQLRPAPAAAGRRGLRDPFPRDRGPPVSGRRVPALAAMLAAVAGTGGRDLRGMVSSSGGPHLPGHRVLAIGATLAAVAAGAWYLSTGGDAVPGREAAATGGGEGRGAKGAALAPAPSMPAPGLSPEGGAEPSDPAGDGAARPSPGPPGPERIRAVQRALARLGYPPGPMDGLMGLRTRSAIRAYQAAAGLTADGRLTPELERGIRAAAAAAATDP